MNIWYISVSTLFHMSDFLDPDTTRKEKLEKIKLVEEITNLRKPFYKTPTFWPPVLAFLTALIVYLYTWQSGIFDIREKRLQYQTDTLQKTFNALEREVRYKRDSLQTLTVQNQQLLSQNALLNSNVEKTKRASVKAIQDLTNSITNKNLTKQELKQKTISLIKRYRQLRKDTDISMDTTRRYWDSLQRASKYSPAMFDNANRAEQFFVTQLMMEYNVNLKDSAIFLRQQLLAQLPNYKETNNNIEFTYKIPTNFFGLEEVFNDLSNLISHLSEEVILMPDKQNSSKSEKKKKP
jgi:hypothetical protein